MKHRSKAKQKLSSREANFRELYGAYKRRAKRKGIPFSLSSERFRSLTKSPCFLCGAPPKSKYRHNRTATYYRWPYVYNGVDKLRSRGGYTAKNAVACCWACNRAKSTLSLENFLLLIYEIYKHRIEPALKGE